MKYISVSEFASLHSISERTVRNWCAEGKIEGAFVTGKTWNIPKDASIPFFRNDCILWNVPGFSCDKSTFYFPLCTPITHSPFRNAM